MSFLIQRATGRNFTLTSVNTPVLRIGRGTNQELRSENPAVALEHAVIEGDAAGYVITDKGSITGTYVNRKPVETARLTKGDVLEIGDLRIDVQLADPAKPLFLRITIDRPPVIVEDEEEGAHAPAAVAATPGATVVRSRKFDFAGAYRLHRPWLTKLSITALLLVVTLGVIGEVIRPERQKYFMPGGLSSAHARAPHQKKGGFVADDCASCHNPWKGVEAAKCRDCHENESKPHAKHAKNEMDCIRCHPEHRGAVKLADIPSTVCVACHTNLEPNMTLPRAQLASMTFADGRYSFDAIARISAFGTSTHPELVYPKDANTLRFNHKLHLAPRGVPDGKGKRVVLKCATCHDVAGVADPKPVTFEQHCHTCHRLGFDTRLPDEEAPHGGDDHIVYGFVSDIYSGNRDLIGKRPADVRRILATRERVDVDSRAVVAGEKIFKLRCRYCHDVEPRGERLAVTRPVIPTVWLSHAPKFRHDRHAMIDCEKCHETARASRPTSDVLMPKLSNCTDCHAERKGTGQAPSTCRLCHEYHLRPQRQISKAVLAQAGLGGLGGQGRMFQGILLAVIVILLLVVLIPVGIALFQRMRPERSPAPREKAPPPPVQNLPTSKLQALAVEVSTDKVSRTPVAPPPPPPDLTPLNTSASAPTIAPPSDRTRIPNAADPTPSGTEMMQWYGMLHCTSGPLEGQRFIIEDEGFYIGRDPALSKIVVSDTRVSKRHVRIVPRDGKVWAIDSSTNGTFMGGQRISEVQLKRGDTLILADNAATFVYQV